MMIAMLCLVAMPAPWAQADILIDHFDTGFFDLLVNDGTPPTAHAEQSGLANVLGGDRDVTVTFLAGDNDVRGRVSITPASVLRFDESDGAQGSILLRYGHAADLNADLSAGGTATDIRLDYLVADLNSTMHLTVTSHHGELSQQTQTETLFTGSGPHTIKFLYSAFPLIDWTDVDQISLELVGNMNGDYRLDDVRVEAPEPLTMAGLVMGIGGLGYYIRKRRAA